MKDLVSHEDLPYKSSEIRYHALRLAQMKKIEVIRDSNLQNRYPILKIIEV